MKVVPLTTAFITIAVTSAEAKPKDEGWSSSVGEWASSGSGKSGKGSGSGDWSAPNSWGEHSKGWKPSWGEISGKSGKSKSSGEWAAPSWGGHYGWSSGKSGKSSDKSGKSSGKGGKGSSWGEHSDGWKPSWVWKPSWEGSWEGWSSGKSGKSSSSYSSGWPAPNWGEHSEWSSGKVNDDVSGDWSAKFESGAWGGASSEGLCHASCATDGSGKEVCKFTTKVDLFAGELGYYRFEECGDTINPTLGMEVGKTYQFTQLDRSNYFHPLGFAYYPDGAHDNKDELEPGVVPPGSSSSCDENQTCPAPMYYVRGEYKGTYSNNDDLFPVTSDESNFGLDDYEPVFFRPMPQWIEDQEFSVFLKFDKDTDFTKDIFYFCHIHQYMAGRIKLLRDGHPIQKDDLPELGYEYDVPTGHDAECGTYGLNSFQLPHAECPEKFVCDVPSDNGELAQFSDCIDSMDCAMMVGMTTSVKKVESEIALFIHQMIPHHQNAVNMAKALLHTGKLSCDDLTDENSDDCVMEVILREIINNQNAQIQAMRGVLESQGWPQENDCKVVM